jgi:hydrogenase/urease accessory protein HupE
VLGLATPSVAHELSPGYLELSETDSGRFDLLWKQPARDGYRLRIQPVFPAGCRIAAGSRSEELPGAHLLRGVLECDAGLAGGVIEIAGLEALATDVLLRLHWADGRDETHLLKPISPGVTVGDVAGAAGRTLAFLRLGVEHILLGADHLLFVLGLLLIVRDRTMLIKTITSFTLAHSLTLAVATLGYARAPGPPLNAAIALSILFLGPEIVRTWRGEQSVTIRRPWLVAFAFGLLHGFGFASGLTSMGLPASEIPAALALFNVGVEAGQLAFVLLVMLLERSFRVLEIRWPRIAQALPGYAVGSLGAFWSIQRIAMLLGGAR